jgi:hypothetical protein
MFCIKRCLMTKIMKKRREKQPFDYQKAEAFTLGCDGDGTVNNSYYFSAHSLEKNQSFYVRLGLRDNGNAEVWVYFDNGENNYYHKTLLYTTKTSPLKVTNTDGVWGFSFEGELVDQNGKQVFAKTECSFKSNNQAVDFGYHMPASRFGTSIAQDKWSKEYFAEMQKNNSVHYEQEGVLTGTLTLDGKEFIIDLPCLRDHSYGRRVWDYMNNHLWLATVDNQCMFNFSMVSYPSMTILEVGHLREKDNPIEYLTKASYDRNEIVKGEIVNEINMVAQINKKRKINIKAKLLRSIPYVFEDGAYTLIEGIADYELDGIKCRGILEIGFNRDTSRFMNGKKISKIKE